MAAVALASDRPALRRVVTDVDELETVRASLAALVPGAPSGDVHGLVRHVANKLEGHRDCHRLIWPPAGSLTLDDVRARCSALLSTLRPVERRAVLSILTAEEGNGHG